MNRIIVALFALAFMHLASSQQSACNQAEIDLSNDTTCLAGLLAVNSSVICMGSCRTLIDDVINYCNGTDPTVSE